MPQPQTTGEGTFLIDAALKAQQWEIAKGHLRALVALQGSYSTAGDPKAGKWYTLEQKVNAFIEEIEDDALAD